MGVNMLTGFIIAPFLVRHLGDTVYGLWILIASLVFYFGLLDLGVRGAVGRDIAFYQAKGDRDGVNATLNTALSLLCGAGLVAFLGTLLLISVFFYMFDVPPAHVDEVRMALVLVGLNLALWLPLSMFDSMLWAYQRFDLINMVDMISCTLRALLSYWVVVSGEGLVGLALISLLTLAGSQAIKGIIIFRLDRELVLALRYIGKQPLKRLMGIGFWNSILMLAWTVNGQVGPMIVGAKLTVGLVTPFSIASRLLTYGRETLVASTGVLTPVAISFHARDEKEQQHKMFIIGGAYCTALAIFFVAIFLLLGETIISLWMGPSLAWASSLLVVLAIGEALPMSQWVTYSVILGKYRHRALATIFFIETSMAVALSLLMVKPYGLMGVCVAFALSATLLRGVYQMIYGCRLIGVSIARYLAVSILPVLGISIPPALVLWEMTRWMQPQGWVTLIGCLAVYAVLHGLFLAMFGAAVWIRIYGLSESLQLLRSKLARSQPVVLNPLPAGAQQGEE